MTVITCLPLPGKCCEETMTKTTVISIKGLGGGLNLKLKKRVSHKKLVFFKHDRLFTRVEMDDDGCSRPGDHHFSSTQFRKTCPIVLPFLHVCSIRTHLVWGTVLLRTPPIS